MTGHGIDLLDDPVAMELLASRLPAHLAYTWSDGTPRVVPIWFHWTGTEVVMGTPPRAPKLRALHDGDIVCVSIDSSDWPYHVVSIRGPVTVTTVDGVVPEYSPPPNAISVNSKARTGWRNFPPTSRCRGSRSGRRGSPSSISKPVCPALCPLSESRRPGRTTLNPRRHACL